MTKVSTSRKPKARPIPKTASRSASRSRRPAAATKLDQLAELLAQREGASIEEMMSATGWQSHSVRGALAGSLKRRGLIISSAKIDGVRRYKSEAVR